MSERSVCYYHEDHEAIGHCENCNRLICFECNLTHRVRYSGGRYSSGYVEKFAFCPICKYSLDEKFSLFGFIFTTLFFSIFIAVGILVLFVMGSPPEIGVILFSALFIAIPSIMFLVLLDNAFISGPKKRAEATRKKNEFANSVGLDEYYKKMGAGSEIAYSNRPKSIIINKKSFHCNQCGTLLDKKARFCPTCGDSTQDELEMMRRS